MKNFQIVVKNTFVLTFIEFIMKAVAVVWMVFLARNLGVDGFGKYNFINAFILIFSFLPDMGVGMIFVREVAQDKSLAKKYLGNCLFLNFCLSIFAFLFIFLAINVLHYPKETVILIAIASFTLIISTLRSVGSWMFEAHEKLEVSGLLTFVNTILSLSGGFIFFQLTKNISGLFLGMLSGTFISFLITWMMIFKNFGRPIIKLNLGLWKHLIIEGFPLAFAAFAYYLYTKIDTVMLSKYSSDKAIGWYNAATIFSFSAIQFFNVPLAAAIYPTLSRILASDYPNLAKVVQKLLWVVILWSIPFAVFVSIFAKELITLIYGSNYGPSIAVLRIVVWFTPFAALSAFLYKILIILKKQKIYLYISLFGSIFNIILNFFIIPKFGIVGAAVSTVVTQVVIFLIYIRVLQRFVRPIFSFSAFTKEDLVKIKQTINDGKKFLSRR